MRGQAWWEVPERTAVLSVRSRPALRLPPDANPRRETRRLRDLYFRWLEEARGEGAPAESPDELREVGT